MDLSSIISTVVIEDSLYCVDGHIGVLYELDLNSWSIKSTIKIKGIFKNGYKACYLFVHIDKIWIVPVYSSQIVEYNLNSKKLHYYEDLEKHNVKCTAYAVLNNNTIYMLPRNVSDGLTEFNVETKQFQKKILWDKLFGTNVNDVIVTAAHDESLLMITEKNQGNVILFDMIKGEIWKKRMARTDFLSGVVYHGGYFYCLTEKERKIISWNKKDDVVKEYFMQQEGLAFLKAIVLYDSLLVTDGKELFLFKNERFERFPAIEGIKLQNSFERQYHFIAGSMWKNKIVLAPCDCNMFLEYEPRGNKFQTHIIEVLKKDELINELYDGINYVYEGIYTLADYIQVLDTYEGVDLEERLKNSVGDRIHKGIVS